MPSTVVIIGTGGTIAGSAARADQRVGYAAGALSPQALVSAVPPLAGLPIETLAVAAINSKDMGAAVWQALARCCAEQLARPEVAGVVVTHGTDTLEETGYLLHRVLPAPKPVVLTAAMRPATALSADGPQNLLDAVTLAGLPGVQGVLAMLGGRVWAAHELRKLHGFHVDAFSAGDFGPLAVMENGELRAFRAWPQAPLHAADLHATPAAAWPVVEIVTSHAGARGATIAALVAAGARGIVIAATGNGEVHHELEAAAQQAQQRGVLVRRSSRCLLGGVAEPTIDPPPALPSCGALTPYQARVEMLLDLLA